MSSQDMVLIGSSTLHSPQQVIARLDGLDGQQNTIVLLSSHEPALYDAMLAHGAVHCLSKPINHRKLLHALLSPRRYAVPPARADAAQRAGGQGAGGG